MKPTLPLLAALLLAPLVALRAGDAPKQKAGKPRPAIGVREACALGAGCLPGLPTTLQIGPYTVSPGKNLGIRRTGRNEAAPERAI